MRSLKNKASRPDMSRLTRKKTKYREVLLPMSTYKPRTNNGKIKLKCMRMDKAPTRKPEDFLYNNTWKAPKINMWAAVQNLTPFMAQMGMIMANRISNHISMLLSLPSVKLISVHIFLE
jgi:hypothetical protein